ncbi:MAG: hypothetical protein O7D30_12055, partial [Rickettsia endosymbiont of Ixodes persulcatus]|nr:hypothetical protein [Rickettsia endosymbiont of Ixodes persulcatus]
GVALAFMVVVRATLFEALRFGVLVTPSIFADTFVVIVIEAFTFLGALLLSPFITGLIESQLDVASRL